MVEIDLPREDSVRELVRHFKGNSLLLAGEVQAVRDRAGNRLEPRAEFVVLLLGRDIAVFQIDVDVRRIADRELHALDSAVFSRIDLVTLSRVYPPEIINVAGGLLDELDGGRIEAAFDHEIEEGHIAAHDSREMGSLGSRGDADRIARRRRCAPDRVLLQPRVGRHEKEEDDRSGREHD